MEIWIWELEPYDPSNDFHYDRYQMLKAESRDSGITWSVPVIQIGPNRYCITNPKWTVIAARGAGRYRIRVRVTTAGNIT